MPTYEYECKDCSYGFEIFQSMSDSPLKDCPKCGKEVRRLIFGGTGVIFKGSGFYVTDKGKVRTQGSGTQSSGKTETKPDSSKRPESCGESVKCDSCPMKGSASSGESVGQSKSA